MDFVLTFPVLVSLVFVFFSLGMFYEWSALKLMLQTVLRKHKKTYY